MPRFTGGGPGVRENYYTEGMIKGDRCMSGVALLLAGLIFCSDMT